MNRSVFSFAPFQAESAPCCASWREFLDVAGLTRCALRRQVEKVNRFTQKLVEEHRQVLHRLNNKVQSREGEDDERDKRLLQVRQRSTSVASHTGRRLVQ